MICSTCLRFSRRCRNLSRQFLSFQTMCSTLSKWKMTWKSARPTPFLCVVGPFPFFPFPFPFSDPCDDIAVRHRTHDEPGLFLTKQNLASAVFKIEPLATLNFRSDGRRFFYSYPSRNLISKSPWAGKPCYTVAKIIPGYISDVCGQMFTIPRLEDPNPSLSISSRWKSCALKQK